MKVFVTGAAGFIGQATTSELLAHGHSVLGLARSDANAAVLEKLGAEVLRGDITDPEALKKGASSSDGVVHLAFIHDFSNPEGACATDRAAIEAMGDAIAGTGKPLVIIQGLLSLPGGITSTEETDHVEDGSVFALRSLSEKLVIKLSKEKNFRGMSVRFSPTVHGKGEKGFITTLVDIAKQKGFVTIISDTDGTWSAVHRLDAAALLRLAIEKGTAGSVYHAVAENLAVKDILSLISKKTGKPLKSLPLGEAMQEIGFLAAVSTMDRPSSSAKTQAELGWKPTQAGLLEDLEKNYF